MAYTGVDVKAVLRLLILSNDGYDPIALFDSGHEPGVKVVPIRGTCSVRQSYVP
jgi:hypothetical protein